MSCAPTHSCISIRHYTRSMHGCEICVLCASPSLLLHHLLLLKRAPTLMRCRAISMRACYWRTNLRHSMRRSTLTDEPALPTAAVNLLPTITLGTSGRRTTPPSCRDVTRLTNTCVSWLSLMIPNKPEIAGMTLTTFGPRPWFRDVVAKWKPWAQTDWSCRARRVGPRCIKQMVTEFYDAVKQWD